MGRKKSLALLDVPPSLNVAVDKETLSKDSAVPTDEKSGEELSDVIKGAGISSASDTPIEEVKSGEVIPSIEDVAVPTPSSNTTIEEGKSEEVITPEREIVVMPIEKSPLNFMPDCTDREFQILKDDMKKNGWDIRFAIIWLFENKILDGWQKERAYRELLADGYTDAKYKPVYKEFVGTPQEANEFVWRNAKGRNLTPTQWGELAVFESPEYLESIEVKVKSESKEKQKRKPKSIDSVSSSGTNKNPNQRKSTKTVADLVGSTPDIIKFFKKLKKSALPTEELGQIIKDFKAGMTIKEYEAKVRKAREQPNQPPLQKDDTKVLPEEDGSTRALETGDNGKSITIETESEEHNPLKPVLTERYVGEKAKKAIRKIIALQMGKRVIEDKIKSLGEGDITELNEKRSASIDNIRSKFFEFGYLILSGKEYDHETMKDFDEIFTL